MHELGKDELVGMTIISEFTDIDASQFCPHSLWHVRTFDYSLASAKERLKKPMD